MNIQFLYGLYPASQFYVATLILTWIAHFAAVSYVVGGVFYLAWRQLVSKTPNPLDRGISFLIRDWMPFALGAAITLGVAPLLFVQIVYPRHFYTANLLLAWRWMMIIPAAVVGFYLLYLIKSDFFLRSSRGPRMIILASAALCFLFVGAGWSSNYVLMQLDSSWPHIYFDVSTLDTVLPYILIRISAWIGAMLLTFPMLLLWQLRWTNPREENEFRATAGGLVWIVRSGVGFSLLGLALMHLPFIWAEWKHLDEWLFRRTMETAVAAGLLYWIYWESVPLVEGSTSRASVMTLVWGVGALAGAAAREMNRMGSIVIEYQQHWMEDASGAGGFWSFLVFLAINALLVGYCIKIVNRALKHPDPS